MKCLLGLCEGVVLNENDNTPVIDERWQRVTEILRVHFDIILLCSKVTAINSEKEAEQPSVYYPLMALNHCFKPETYSHRDLYLINTPLSETEALKESAPELTNNAELLHAIARRVQISPMMTVLCTLSPDDIILAGQKAIKHALVFDPKNFEGSMSDLVFQCYKTLIDDRQWNYKENSHVFFGAGAKRAHLEPTGIIRLRQTMDFDDLLATVTELMQTNAIKLHPHVLDLYTTLRDDLTDIKAVIYSKKPQENQPKAQSAQPINTSFTPK